MINQEVTEEVKRVLGKLKKTEPGTEEYKKLRQDLMELDKVRLAEEESDCRIGNEDRKIDLMEREFKSKQEKESNIKWYQRIDPNILVSAGVSIFSIFSILNFEKIGVVASKALGFVNRPKWK